MEFYKTLTKSNKFIGNQPVSLTKKSFDKTEEYFFTEKLDGKRFLLLFTDNKVYRISSKMEFEEKKIANDIPGTILDCEYFKGKYHVFDILFFKHTDTRNLKYNTRIQLYTQNLKSKQLIPKVQIPIGKDACKLLPGLVNKLKHRFTEGDLDGIILTPNTDYYAKVYKYKPRELLSIDFKISKKNGDTFLLLLQNDEVFKRKEYPGIGIVKVSKEVYKKYKTGSVVEFIFKDNKFIPLRPRPDKTNSNGLHVILDNFKLLTSKWSLKSILC